MITGKVVEFTKGQCVVLTGDATSWWSVHEDSAGLLVPLRPRYLLYYLSQQFGLWQPEYVS